MIATNCRKHGTTLRTSICCSVLENTVYHYTNVPAEIWEELKADEEPYDYYSMEIEGNYDARDGGVPSYK